VTLGLKYKLVTLTFGGALQHDWHHMQSTKPKLAPVQSIFAHFENLRPIHCRHIIFNFIVSSTKYIGVEPKKLCIVVDLCKPTSAFNLQYGIVTFFTNGLN
jgi:hypothetical protein